MHFNLFLIIMLNQCYEMLNLLIYSIQSKTLILKLKSNLSFNLHCFFQIYDLIIINNFFVCLNQL